MSVEKPRSVTVRHVRWSRGAVLTVCVAPFLTACGGAQTLDAGDATVLVSERRSDGMTALLQGRVEVFGDCLGIAGIDNIGSVVVVWPHDTQVERSDPVTVDIPEVGTVKVGDEVQIGGGFITEAVGGPASGPVGGVEIPVSCLDYKVWLAN